MKKRFTEQQIIGFLKDAEAGMPVKELCRKHGFSDASFYTWRAKFGGMEVSEARRLKVRRQSLRRNIGQPRTLLPLSRSWFKGTLLEAHWPYRRGQVTPARSLRCSRPS
nr:transposase [Burkholderia mallei]